MEIDKVIVSGFFSDWSESDDNYRLTQVSHNRWEIRLKLPPGRNQYKFVVYTKRPYLDEVSQAETNLFWMEDTKSPVRVDDGFSGYNSAVDVGSADDIRFFFNVIAVIGLSILLIYTLFSIVIQYVMRLKLKLKYKITLSLIFIILGSNVLFISYAFYEKAGLVQHGTVEELNLVHHFLTVSGVDFGTLDRDDTRRKLKASLETLFQNVTPRIERRKER